MSLTLKNQIEIYLNNKRRLGFQLKIEGQELLRFAEYAAKKKHKGSLTTAIAIEWASSSKKGSRLSWAQRLEIIRCFAKYYYAFDSKIEIPPNRIFGPAHRRNTPYINFFISKKAYQAAYCVCFA